jgi:hypothetical protein
MKILRLALLPVLLVTTASAQAPQSNTVRGFIRHAEPVIVLTNARVIDGTGAPAKENQAIVIRNGDIAALGPAAGVKVPEGAVVLDLAGKTAWSTSTSTTRPAGRSTPSWGRVSRGSTSPAA